MMIKAIPRDFYRISDQKAYLRLTVHFLFIGIFIIFGSIAFHKNFYIAFALCVWINGFFVNGLTFTGLSHELVHKTVFKKKSKNQTFLYWISIFLWQNPFLFSYSHPFHHKNCLEEGDLEVVPGIKKNSINRFIGGIFFSFVKFKTVVYYHFLNALGIYKGSICRAALNSGKVKGVELKNYSRLLLLIQITLIFIFAISGFPELIFLIVLPVFFNSFAFDVMSSSQHYMLNKSMGKFNNTRTIRPGRFLNYFYWEMGYHLEHHLYPNVPFYKLHLLHKYLTEADTDEELKPPLFGFTNVVSLTHFNNISLK